MGIFSGCLLVSDIDGTLYHNKAIPPKNLEAIEYFKSEGGFFTIATGRGPAISRNIGKAAGVNAPMITTNGSVIYDSENDKILHATYLTESANELIKNAVKRFPNLGALVTVDGAVLTLNDTPDVERARMYDDLENESTEGYDKWQKVLFILSDAPKLKKVKEYLNEVKIPDVCYIESSPEYYEVLPSGISKATNLKKLAELIPQKITKIFTIGDYYNDLEMVKAADIGAFTEEAPDELKAQADYISVSAPEGAVADFINYLTTIQKTRKDECNG